MKIIQSFWTKPMIKGRRSDLFNRLNGGWSNRSYNYFSWALSCLKLLEHYDQVELITDSLGKSILVDTLNLPYTSYSVALNCLGDSNPDLWAMGKIHSYSIQKTPFIHVDGDFFIWDRFPQSIENAELVAQHKEDNQPHYWDYVECMQSDFTFLPDFMKEIKKENAWASNAGIFGGNNIDFFKQYCRRVQELIERNNLAFKGKSIGMFNSVYEQCVFYHLAKKNNVKVTYLFDGVDALFNEISEFNNVPHYSKFIHAMSFHKTNETGRHIEMRLLMEYPEYYFKITNLLKSNII